MRYCHLCNMDTHNLKDCMSPTIYHFELECNQYYLQLQKHNPSKIIPTMTNWLLNHYIMNQQFIYYFAIIRCKLPTNIQFSNHSGIISSIIQYFTNCYSTEIIYKNIPNSSVNTTKDTDKNTFSCCICLDNNIPISQMILLTCNHSFCSTCITTYFAKNEHKENTVKTCFLCRSPLFIQYET